MCSGDIFWISQAAFTKHCAEVPEVNTNNKELLSLFQDRLTTEAAELEPQTVTLIVVKVWTEAWEWKYMELMVFLYNASQQNTFLITSHQAHHNWVGIFLKWLPRVGYCVKYHLFEKKKTYPRDFITFAFLKRYHWNTFISASVNSRR